MPTSFFTLVYAVILKFEQNYGEVALYKDSLGKELLIDKIENQYSKVHLELNELHDYSLKLWALGKVITYSP